MSNITTVGKILLRHHAPTDTHKFLDSTTLDKKGIGQFFSDLVDKHPDQYEEVVSQLSRLGFNVATRLGSSVRLTDLLPPSFKEAKFKQLNKEIEVVKAKHLTKKKEADEITDILDKFNKEVDKELVDEGIRENKTLAKVIKAGARGSPQQYRQTIFSPVAVNDNKGGVLTDFIIDRSFAEGLTLPQYLAHTFGSRQASAAGKLSVSAGGFISKQITRAGMTVIVTMHDCGTHRGVEVPVSDKEYIGCFLAQPVDKYNYNNEITPSMLADLHSKKVIDIIVRNPITCEASHRSSDNAVCQLCVGKRELGLPALDAYVGISAGSAISEPTAQAALSSKHSGGSAKAKQQFGGIKYINQLFNIPEVFLHEAPLADHDGTVSDVRVAAQGGHYVDILTDNNKKEEHYIHPDLKPTVHKNQKVEAGDVLSEGIPNPAKIVEHKGIGEGRVYFSKALKDTYDNSGLGGINRRNFDTVSKSLISHVKITNPHGLGNYLPDSIVNYHSLERDYEPRIDSKKVRTDMAKGLYLEKPELHYTIGTKLNSSNIAQLKKHGIEYVTAHEDPPDFAPEMQRLLDVPAHEHDWAHALYSTNLERRFLRDVNTGAHSNIRGPSPVMGLAFAVGFGSPQSHTKTGEAPEELLSFE